MIGVRLPVDVDAELRRRAEKAGMTPAKWLEGELMRNLATSHEVTDAVGVVARSGVGDRQRMVTPRFK